MEKWVEHGEQPESRPCSSLCHQAGGLGKQWNTLVGYGRGLTCWSHVRTSELWGHELALQNREVCPLPVLLLCWQVVEDAGMWRARGGFSVRVGPGSRPGNLSAGPGFLVCSHPVYPPTPAQLSLAQSLMGSPSLCLMWGQL